MSLLPKPRILDIMMSRFTAEFYCAHGRMQDMDGCTLTAIRKRASNGRTELRLSFVETMNNDVRTFLQTLAREQSVMIRVITYTNAGEVHETVEYERMYLDEADVEHVLDADGPVRMEVVMRQWTA